MSDYSIYAFNEEIKRGYITLRGGCRVGICGSVVSNGVGIVTLKNISSLNIRVSREIKGCADKVLGAVYDNEQFFSTLIISPPACGKTTLLRDMIRQLSNRGYCIGVVDERSEIAGMYMGQAQNDLGLHTDVMDACTKSVGMYMLLRSMGPDIIAVDEIGSDSELKCITDIVNSGVGLLCTVHSRNAEELIKKPFFKQLVSEKVFRRYIILGNKPVVGTVVSVMNEELMKI
jgi:stage III sporulation protein AA